MTVQIKPTALSDEQLFEQFREHHDFTAFAELVRRYFPPLIRFFRAHFCSWHDAEDLAQTTFFHIYSRADQFQSDRRFLPWLYSTADHLRIDWLRRERSRPHVSLETSLRDGDSIGLLQSLLREPAKNAGADESTQEDRERLQVALSHLPETLRETIHLVYVQGEKYEDAAQRLNIPIGTVKSRVHSAIERLKTEFRTYRQETNLK